jgi:hypothetical protein
LNNPIMEENDDLQVEAIKYSTLYNFSTHFWKWIEILSLDGTKPCNSNDI